MTSGFRVGITVRRARPEVSAVMFDLHYLPAWRTGIRNVEILSGEPPQEGSRVMLRGARPDAAFEILEHETDLTLVLRSDSRTLSLGLEGVPVGTVVWLGVEIERTGLSRLIGLWTDRRARRVAIRDLRRLKQFIESGGYRTWLAEDSAEEG
jgi:hypothetical protein